MKKYLLYLVPLLICLCLCGCGDSSWKSKVQISTLKYEDDYIIGKMKNLTDKPFEATIKFKLKSGSLEDENTCYETIKPNETIDIKCLVFGINDTYTFEIKNVELEEFEIPSLKEGKISKESFEYHFKEIYDAHLLNYTTFGMEFGSDSYPYIDEITYEDDEIQITKFFGSDKKSIMFTTTYNAKTAELDSLNGTIVYNNDEDFLHQMVTKISLMRSLNNLSYATKSPEIIRSLLNTDIEIGKCWVVDKWCIIPSNYDAFYSFSIYNND